MLLAAATAFFALPSVYEGEGPIWINACRAYRSENQLVVTADLTGVSTELVRLGITVFLFGREGGYESTRGMSLRHVAAGTKSVEMRFELSQQDQWTALAARCRLDSFRRADGASWIAPSHGGVIWPFSMMWPFRPRHPNTTFDAT